MKDLKKENFWICECEQKNVHSNDVYFCFCCDAIEPEQCCPNDFQVYSYTKENDESCYDYDDYLEDQNFLTEDQAIKQWIDVCMESVIEHYEQDYEPDAIARSQSFSNYMDMLHKDNVIDDKLVGEICIPDHLETCSLSTALRNY